MKKVSIIVPIYNDEKYVVNCVRSIMFQNYNNIEIILIDDGSKDNSGIIIDKLEKQDKSLQIKSQG